MHKFWDAGSAKIYANFLLTNAWRLWYNIVASCQAKRPATRQQKGRHRLAPVPLGKEDFLISSVLVRVVGFEPTSARDFSEILPIKLYPQPPTPLDRGSNRNHLLSDCICGRVLALALGLYNTLNLLQRLRLRLVILLQR